MKKYKLLNMYGKLGAILMLNDAKDEYTTSIPINEENTDYQEYLKWVEEGNEPEPADE